MNFYPSIAFILIDSCLVVFYLNEFILAFGVISLPMYCQPKNLFCHFHIQATEKSSYEYEELSEFKFLYFLMA